MYFTQQCVWHFFPPSSLGQDPTLVGVLSQAEASRRINVSADIPTSERALAQSYYVQRLRLWADTLNFRAIKD